MAAKGVLKTWCVMDGKIRMTQKMFMKTVVALKKKKQQHAFHHENIAYKGNALTLMNIEPSLYVCGIAHCT